MPNKHILATALLLSLAAAPAFSDDQNVDCQHAATTDHPACTKTAEPQPSVVTEQVFSNSDSQQCQ